MHNTYAVVLPSREYFWTPLWKNLAVRLEKYYRIISYLLVTEELQGTNKSNTCIISCLESGNQEQFLSFGTAAQVALFRCTVGGGGSTQDGEQQSVAFLKGVANSPEQNWGTRFAGDDGCIVEKVVPNNESVVTIKVRFVEIEVVHHKCAFIFKFYTTLFGNLSNRIGELRSASNHHAVAIINEVEDCIKSNFSSKFCKYKELFLVRAKQAGNTFGGWGKEDKDVIQVVAIRGKCEFGICRLAVLELVKALE